MSRFWAVKRDAKPEEGLIPGRESVLIVRKSEQSYYSRPRIRTWNLSVNSGAHHRCASRE